MAGTSGVSLKAAGSMAASIHSWKKVACPRAQTRERVIVLLSWPTNRVSYTPCQLGKLSRASEVPTCGLHLQCYTRGGSHKELTKEPQS